MKGVLAFTASHGNDRVCVCGHFAVAPNDQVESLEFYRNQSALISVSMSDGAEMYRANNFVRNV